MELFSNTQIDVTALPKSQDLTLQPISPKYFIIIIINTSMTYAVLIGALITLNMFAEDIEFNEVANYAVGILCVLFLLSMLIAFLGFKKRKYAMREKDMTYSHGYLVNKTITLPYNRIQHIEIARSFLARKFGLSTLKIYSAGQSGGDLSIKGLPKDIADDQYAFLTKIINERL
jgi:membrane protein YdbS with pleckstrin-like domain